MFAAERALNQERMEAREGMKTHLDKLGRGERLSVEERTDLDARNARISEIEAELRSYEAARAAAEAGAAEVGSAPTPELSRDELLAQEFRTYLRTGALGSEMRTAQGVGTPQAGGYLVPPGWFQRLQVALKAYGGIANDFEQLETESGQPMQWATQDPTSTVGTLVGAPSSPNENQQIPEADLTFGTATLGAYMYSSGVQLVSIQLANDSAFDIDAFITARSAESLGRAKAAAAISGTGSSQPLGIIPALSGKGAWSAGGSGGYIALAAGTKVPQASGDTTSTELTANTLSPLSLRQMVAGVDVAYRDLGAKFYMNDTQLLGLRGQVDSNGRPLVNLQDGLSQGEPTTLWGYPVKVDNNIPNITTASTVGGPVFGHLSAAMIVRTVTQSGLLRLSERYADYLQVGFIGFMRFDIRSNDLRAAVTVKTNAT